ncbi:MAG: hypothetical protein HYZ23_09400 [Chloroflexi bacterium]|nr:hypothetical protein [Chloroflexota bacterium]
MKNFFLFIGCLVFVTACQNADSTPQTESAPGTATQTPPPPATATPTLIPTSTATATPIPKYFTEEFNTDLGAWASFQTGGEQIPSIKLENDLLRIDIASPHTWYYAIHGAHEYSEVFINAKFTGTPSGSMGLMCNYTESNGWYEFNIASDGTYSVLFGQWLAQGIAQYSPITTDTVEYLHPESLDYEIGLACINDTLLLHVDGKLFRKLDVARFGLAGGKIGITASSFEEASMIAVFHWVKVGEPE